MNYYSENKWWASPFNEEKEVRAQLQMAKQVKIHDATLRDGEQTPGVVFSIDDKVKIAEMLNEIGVERIEAGMPAVSSDDAKAIQLIANRGLNADVYAFVRAMHKDIEVAA